MPFSAAACAARVDEVKLLERASTAAASIARGGDYAESMIDRSVHRDSAHRLLHSECVRTPTRRQMRATEELSLQREMA